MSEFTYLKQEFVDKIRDEIWFFRLKVQTTRSWIFFIFIFYVQTYQLLVQMFLGPTITNCSTPLHVQNTDLCTSLEFQPSVHVKPFPAKLKIIVLSENF